MRRQIPSKPYLRPITSSPTPPKPVQKPKADVGTMMFAGYLGELAGKILKEQKKADK